MVLVHLLPVAECGSLQGLTGVSVSKCLYKGRASLDKCIECCRTVEAKQGGHLMQWTSGPVCACEWTAPQLVATR